MKRKTFLRTMLAAMPTTWLTMKLSNLHQLTDSFDPTPKMPVLFLGHGSPMNAIEENDFVKGFRRVSEEIETPRAILCVSAHWETRGTFVTAMQNPPTIHDFGGFPQELFEVQYPAPGSPELARQTREMVKTVDIEPDEKWGLDHGAWSVIKHMYPKADIPVVQLSLDRTKAPRYHYELAKELFKLRQKGVLIVGSGNMVHNLRLVAWNRLDEEFAYDWAEEAGSLMNQYILEGDHDKLIDYAGQGRAFQLSVPTPEHYLPLLYVLALQDKEDEIALFNDQPIAGSLSMTSVKLG